MDKTLLQIRLPTMVMVVTARVLMQSLGGMLMAPGLVMLTLVVMMMPTRLMMLPMLCMIVTLL